jgi:hypothetical protein
MAVVAIVSSNWLISGRLFTYRETMLRQSSSRTAVRILIKNTQIAASGQDWR